MTAIVLCIVAMLITYVAGRRSLGWGLVTLMSVGYAYGILRANVMSPVSHFIFDAATAGLYASHFWSTKHPGHQRGNTLIVWIVILMIWPVLLCMLPIQTPMITLVGLRANIFFLPMLLLGSRLRENDLKTFIVGLACLNLVAMGFAVAEFAFGIERIFPRSAVTAIMYASKDVAGYTAYRIPGPFTSAHAYAAAMATTLPLLFGMWLQGKHAISKRWMLVGGIGSALIAILMTATRTHFIVSAILLLTVAFTSRIGVRKLVACVVLIGGVSWLAMTSDRFQRFTTLADMEMVNQRIAGSVNRTFLEILVEYPMGNGLGGGGTSIPHFLQSELRRPIAMENEYARILLEQGAIGFVLWVAFLFWSMSRGMLFTKGSWQTGRRLAWLCCACYWGTAMIGIGLLTSIPQTVLLLLSMGWVCTQQAPGAGPRLAGHPPSHRMQEFAYSRRRA